MLLGAGTMFQSDNAYDWMVARAFYMQIGGLVVALLAWVWLIVRAFRTRRGWGFARLVMPPVSLVSATRHPRQGILPTGLFVLSLLVAAAPALYTLLVPLELKPRHKLVEGQRHLTLTGWDRKDYSILKHNADISTPGDVRNALFLARACDLASYEEPESRARFRAELGLDAHLMSADNTQVYVGASAQALVVAFRGSQAPTTLDGLKDWLLTNANNDLILPEEFPGRIFRYVDVEDVVPLLPSISLVANAYRHCPGEVSLTADQAAAAAAELASLSSTDETVSSEVLTSAMVDRVWGTVQGRIAAHLIANYQARIQSRCKELG
jgi:hypothetical protein